MKKMGSRLLAMIDGKEKKGVLSSATITTYGGLVVDGVTDESDFGIGSISLTAKMIDASKVKVPPAANSALKITYERRGL